MCLRVSDRQKCEKINLFFILKSDPEPEWDPDPLVRGSDPRIWIRTTMSRIPKSGLSYVSYCR